MLFATRQQMETIIGKDTYITVVPGGDARLQDAAADAALENASGFASSYVSRWLDALAQLPTEDLPVALRDAVIWIATYNLAGSLWTEHMRRKYEDAEKWLRDVSMGKASLGIVTNPVTSGGGAQLCSRDRQMSRRTLAGVL